MGQSVSILGICDVSVGYGSPEIPAIIHDLANCDWTGDVHLVEPDEPDRPPPPGRPQTYRRSRIDACGLPPQSLSWTRHFIFKSAQIANRDKPDVLVLFGGAIFPVLSLLKEKPASVIYHAYEQIADLPAEALAAHKALLGEVDLVTTPSIRRLIHDATYLNLWPRAVHTIYNVADVAYPDCPKTEERPSDFGLVWCGTLDRKRTFADFFLASGLEDIPIDMYGRIVDTGGLEDAIAALPRLTHHGVVPADALSAALARAAYSIVWWNPANSYGHLHLASNRFFSAIQKGTPPLCAPHPQCLEIAERYGCALVMEDWTEEAFVAAVHKARDMFGTDAYDALVRGCRDACEDGINWAAQSRDMISAIRATL